MSRQKGPSIMFWSTEERRRRLRDAENELRNAGVPYSEANKTALMNSLIDEFLDEIVRRRKAEKR